MQTVRENIYYALSRNNIFAPGFRYSVKKYTVMHMRRRFTYGDIYQAM